MRTVARVALLVAFFCWLGTVRSAHGAETWTEVRSANFRVVTNAGARDAREVAANFERLVAVLRTTSRISTRSDVPLTIVAVKYGKQLKTLLGIDRDDIAGIFAAGYDANVVIVRLDLDREARYQVAYHEYMHLLVRQTIGTLPLWLNEGLAELFGNSRLDTDTVLIGMPAPYHLHALQQNSPLPLAQLLSVDRNSQYYTEANRSTIFYAQSWALTHFLMLGDGGAHRARLAALLQAIDAGATPVEAGTTLGDVPALERQFRAYISRFSFPAQQTTVPNQNDPKAMQARVLPVAEAQAVLSTVHAVLGRPEVATTLATAAVAADGAVPDAWLARARAARSTGDVTAAEAALAKAIALGSNDPLAHFGWAELRLDVVPADHPLDDVATALERALVLKHDLARAMALLGYVRARRNAEDPRAFELCKQAVMLEPGNARHYLLMANALYIQRDQAAVVAALNRAAQVAQGEQEQQHVADARRLLTPR